MDTPADHGPIDREALRARYREERDKRLRPDGNDQYIQPTGRFAHLLDDPYVQPDRARAALRRGDRRVHRRRLRRPVHRRAPEAGRHRRRPHHRGRRRRRRAPGTGTATRARCATRRRWSTCRCSKRPATCRRRSTRSRRRSSRTRSASPSTFGLYDHALFSTEVTRLEWDDAASRWIIHTDRGDRIRARFVAMGTGPLHRPKLPGIPGIETFAGHAFHTSRWDYAYTGGDPTGAPMTKLADKRVGIIGTGATAVQCIPPLGRDAQGALRLPAHAVVDRRAQQPPDRPGVVRHARARLAAGVADELRHPADRRLRRRGPREGRLDRHRHPRARPRRSPRWERRRMLDTEASRRPSRTATTRR